MLHSFPAAGTQLVPERIILEQLDDEFGEVPPIALWRKETSFSVGHGFGNSAAGEADDGSSHCLRFGKYHSKTFRIARARNNAGHTKNACTIQPSLYRGYGLSSEKCKLVQGFAGLFRKFFPQGAVANHNKLGARDGDLNFFHGPKQKLSTF